MDTPNDLPNPLIQTEEQLEKVVQHLHDLDRMAELAMALFVTEEEILDSRENPPRVIVTSWEPRGPRGRRKGR